MASEGVKAISFPFKWINMFEIQYTHQGTGTVSLNDVKQVTVNQKNYYLKKFDMTAISGEMAWYNYMNEIIAAYSVPHPAIVPISYMTLFDKSNQFCPMILTKDKGTALSQHIQKNETDTLNFTEIAYSIASALSTIHSIPVPGGSLSENLLHTDLKPANIVIQRKGDVQRTRLIDFEFARIHPSLRTRQLHSAYNEQADYGKLAPRSDIYSLGMVLWELVKGPVPTSADDVAAWRKNAITGECEKCGWGVADEMIDLTQNVDLAALIAEFDQHLANQAPTARLLCQRDNLEAIKRDYSAFQIKSSKCQDLTQEPFGDPQIIIEALLKSFYNFGLEQNEITAMTNMMNNWDTMVKCLNIRINIPRSGGQSGRKIGDQTRPKSPFRFTLNVTNAGIQKDQTLRFIVNLQKKINGTNLTPRNFTIQEINITKKDNPRYPIWIEVVFP